MIRPALEAAMVVARRGSGGAAEPPRALRPYLGFSKLPAAALKAIARAVDEDRPFRLRVADSVAEDEVGHPGWLWLTRPEGWEDEIAAAQAAADAATAEDAEAREERSARRKLTGARQVIEKAQADAEQLRRQLSRLQDDLAAEHSRRAEAEAALDEVRTSLAEKSTERDRAVRNLKDLEERHTRQGDELRRLRETVDGRSTGPGAEQDTGHRPDHPGLDLADVVGPVVGALGQAAEGIRVVAESLDHLGSSLASRAEALERRGEAAGNARPRPPGGDLSDPSPGRADRGAGHAGPVGPVGGSAGRPASRRVPARLPGGVLDDSTEAADHLIGLPEAVVLVDGYNVSMAGWPDEPVAEQRARLIRCLDGLAARRSALFEVVFDGAEVVPLGPVPQALTRDVHVRFSAPDEEADDVLLEMVGQLPASQTVVVVSSDNRVRTGSHRQGANVLHSRQLLALM